MDMNLESTLIKSVDEAIKRWIDGEKDALIHSYVRDFEERIRSVVASTVLKLYNTYRVEMIEQQLVIRVDIKGESK